ncbi:MAG TPA: [Fe-Fe] hydrogenase large subunit C-terminal domain-containing protein, partial [Clostridia bacterium]
MSIIQFKEANCKNCYKCIRSCPVKAIAFVNEQARIVEEDCMLCGNCLTVCPQNAKVVKNEVDIVKGFIKKKEKVYVSLAPSFVSAFENADEWLNAALKKLGFTFVEETALGAAQVSKQYDRLINERKMKNIITTACPSITLLVQKYYPELVDQLAPVVSPMIAHGKMLRETYGSRIRVVFIGPCLSKKNECRDLETNGVIDAAITFEELEVWMEEEGINSNTDLSEEIKGARELKARIYPAPGGITKTLESRNCKNYQCISVDGVERCMKILDSIKDDNLKGYFIEMNSCSGGCIGGPCMKHIKGGFLEARRRLIAYLKRGLKEQTLLNTEDTKVDLKKSFFGFSRTIEMPSESTIQGILNSIGKFTKDKELNCGACGYSTCRDKAVAVYNDRAQLHMCLPYMRERAESMSNLIINTTPNAIFALNEKLNIQEANFAAQKFFGSENMSLIGKSVFEILECEDFQIVIDSKQNIYDKKYYYEKYDMTVKQSIIYAPEQNIVVVIIQDVTDEEKRINEMHNVREKNVELAQKVIEKQMRVAQEIASLLGETTAETKVV